MNEYGPNGRRNNVIGNGSQINRPVRPEQRRPARQFAPQEDFRLNYDERDYLPPRRREDENTSRKQRYSNISRSNVNAGYESVPSRARKKERDFDDYNFDLRNERETRKPIRSREKQIDFNANDFDDFDADDLFDTFDINEYGEFVEKKDKKDREYERNRRKNKKQKDDRKNTKGDIVWLIVACLEAALSLFVIVLLIILDVLPMIWFIVAIVLLVGIATGLIVTQIKKINRNKKLRIAGRVISIFMCLVLLVASYYIYLTNKAIDSVSKDTGYIINQVHVAVLATDSAESLKDVKDETFGTISSFKPLILNEAMDDFEKQVGGKLKTQDYTNAIDLIEALYSQQQRVIIFNNDLKGDMLEKHEQFEEEVKIIYTFKSKTKINIKSNTDVDVTTQPFLFFISGNDEYGELSVGGRSDVNMLVAVNPVSHEVLLISIPRDYYVQFPGVSGSARDKITHAGIYGLDTQCDTMKGLYGYDVDFYCCVNFSSLIEIVDAIGGVDIDCEMSFTSIDGYNYTQGPMHLNGTYALHYVRERHAFFDGDFARGRHQEQVIEAIIHKLLSSTGLTVYSQLVNTLERVCVTNMPKESISALIKTQLAQGGTWNISKVQAEGATMTQPSYASGGLGLSVVMPYSGSISLIKEFMGQLYAGEPVQARQMDRSDNHSYVITPLPVPQEEEEQPQEEPQQEEEEEEEEEDPGEGGGGEEGGGGGEEGGGGGEEGGGGGGE